MKEQKLEWDYEKLFDETVRIGDILEDKIGMELCDPPRLQSSLREYMLILQE